LNAPARRPVAATSIGKGAPFPLGATPDFTGVNFALFSENATAVELCLFSPDGKHEIGRLRLPGRTADVFHGRVEGIRAGQLYGYRVHGPYEPEAGHRFNPNKLLIDPYARGLHGSIRWSQALYGYPARGRRKDLGFDRRDSAPLVPKGVVTAASSVPDTRPRRSWTETVIYEAHVKGLTQRHPDIPPALRGTYAALGHPAMIKHLLGLGITAIELLPIHAFSDDHFLVRKGLRNYWGYSTLDFFAPDHRYFGKTGPEGLKEAIAALHEAGIEVILDVVYNHTAEGNELGPTLSFRGIDNASYYRLAPGDERHCFDVTGTGNTLDASHPRVVQLMVDSLRHWVAEYGVDGFRFDLAPTLARDPLAFSAHSGFLRAVAADPLLADVKLIAEPWDIGQGGYQLGGFPPGWSEWNDRFRDTARAFWRGDPGARPQLSAILTGSREVFEPSGRDAFASINLVTCHDGFTLHDLVSYKDKHNAANLEDNRDGHDHNLSCNHGAEGPTTHPEINALRARHKRNLLATLFLAQGVPMLLAGDELSNSQGGNNNAYCQDNEIAWIDWAGGRALDPDLPRFVARLSELRRELAPLRRATFLTGQENAATGLKDVYWLSAAGHQMRDHDWHDGSRTLGMQTGNGDPGSRVLLLVNSSPEPIVFNLADDLPGGPWRPILDTTSATGVPECPEILLSAGGTFDLASRSVVLFRHVAITGQD
jgi:isoamylase